MQLDNDFVINFDNYDLGLIAWFTPTSRLPNNMPDIDLKAIQLVRSDGGIVVSRQFTKKIIEVYGYILAPSRQSYEEAIDQLKWKLSVKQRPLIITQSGAERIYTASCTALSDGFIEAGKSFISITFECNDPFGKDAFSTIYTSGTLTAATNSVSYVFEGYVDVLPRITTTFTAVAGAANKSVYIGNRITGQEIMITRSWSNADVLVVDSDIQQVLVNGVSVDYTGFFPVFEPGTAYLQYRDDFTTRSIIVGVEYVKKYL